MSEDNSTPPQEDKLISQAKKRLLGASVILFILLISAPFVLKNRNEAGPTEPIKISMESSPVIADTNVENIKPPETKPETPALPNPQVKKKHPPHLVISKQNLKYFRNLVVAFIFNWVSFQTLKK